MTGRLPRYKRQYNLEVYEHGPGRHDRCHSFRAGRAACRTCGDSFHSVCTQGCFLSHTQRVHGNGLAMAHSRICAARIYDRDLHVWTDSCQSDLSSPAHTHSITNPDSDPDCDPDAVTHPYEHTHRYIDAGRDSDLYSNTDCNIDIDPESDTIRNTDSDGHCFGHLNQYPPSHKHSLSFSHCDEVTHGN